MPTKQEVNEHRRRFGRSARADFEELLNQSETGAQIRARRDLLSKSYSIRVRPPPGLSMCWSKSERPTLQSSICTC